MPYSPFTPATSLQRTDMGRVFSELTHALADGDLQTLQKAANAERKVRRIPTVVRQRLAL